MSAITIPAPESRSIPAAWISMEPLTSRERIWLELSEEFADFTRAAIAAACGAAADVPKKKVGNPPAPVTETPSAAVRSGLFRSCPPEEVKLPGVNGVPSPAKKMRRGPSELNHSTALPE